MTSAPIQPESRLFEAWVAAVTTVMLLLFGQIIGWMLVELLFWIGFDVGAMVVAMVLTAVVAPMRWMIDHTGELRMVVTGFDRFTLGILLSVGAIVFWTLLVFIIRFAWLTIAPAPGQAPPTSPGPTQSKRELNRAARKARRQGSRA